MTELQTKCQSMEKSKAAQWSIPNSARPATPSTQSIPNLTKDPAWGWSTTKGLDPIWTFTTIPTNSLKALSSGVRWICIDSWLILSPWCPRRPAGWQSTLWLPRKIELISSQCFDNSQLRPVSTSDGSRFKKWAMPSFRQTSMLKKASKKMEKREINVPEISTPVFEIY